MIITIIAVLDILMMAALIGFVVWWEFIIKKGVMK